MDITNVILKHEELHFVNLGDYSYKIYVSEIADSGVYLIVKRGFSTKEFTKDEEDFVAMVTGLEAAREKALEIKATILRGKQE